MSAITFVQALDAVRGRAAPAEALRCVEALRSAQSVSSCQETPTLHRVHKSVAEDYAMTPGELVYRVLRTDARALSTGLAIVTGVAVSKKRALRLHGDCWLALQTWITDWNRSQIRRVA